MASVFAELMGMINDGEDNLSFLRRILLQEDGDADRAIRLTDP